MNEQFSADAQSIIESIRKVKAERDMWRKVATALHGSMWADKRSLAFTGAQDDAIDQYEAAVKAAKDGDA